MFWWLWQQTPRINQRSDLRADDLILLQSLTTFFVICGICLGVMMAVGGKATGKFLGEVNKHLKAAWVLFRKKTEH